jgi:hypothetical protein
MAALRGQVPGSHGHSDDQVREVAARSADWDAINGNDPGTTLANVRASAENTALLWQVQGITEAQNL